ncbi:hypothetical protein [Pseudomonas sp. IPO3774]|uniref:hypothetical protein n=1 Tax=Pseudomonas sp. IPO3774 TaxID=2738826 RepID=UPI0015A1B7DF|nr:hypothetical protein [Pseudomonas sp. IPO3774]NWD65753.1 hypothetical protein [Pseudomonas sp. IPO3774]
MKDIRDIDKNIIEAISDANSALVSLIEHVVASDKVLIEVVGMLTQRAVSDERIEDVRSMVKALGQTKEKSTNTLVSIKKALISAEKLSSLGEEDEE